MSPHASRSRRVALWHVSPILGQPWSALVTNSLTALLRWTLLHRLLRAANDLCWLDLLATMDASQDLFRVVQSLHLPSIQPFNSAEVERAFERLTQQMAGYYPAPCAG